MSAEPIGVMKCWECVEKHARDMEHHLEDIVRAMKGDKERIKFEDWIDYIRDIRRYAHTQAKDIATEDLEKSSPEPEEEEEEIEFSEPIRREHGKEVYVDVYHEKEECHPSSFRVIKPNPEHLLTICCPTGQYSEEAGRCLVGTMAQKLEHLHPEGEGSCPVCGGA